MMSGLGDLGELGSNVRQCIIVLKKALFTESLEGLGDGDFDCLNQIQY